MPVTLMLSLVLVGAAASAAAIVGLFLPEGERLTAALPLVLGAGVGVAVLAVGVFAAGPKATAVVLVASAAGFLATTAGLAALWSRARGTAQGPSVRSESDG